MTLPVLKIEDLIHRSIYEDKINPYINKNLIKVFTGQRRVGKSYMLFQTMNVIREMVENPNIVYINKEDIRFDHIKNYSQLITFVEKHKDQSTPDNYLFIDEVQDIQDFEKALRHFQASKEWDVYCTGSNAKLLSGDLATYLSGRYIEIKIYSLSYKEFLLFHKLENKPQSLTKYLKFGGLPYLKNIELSDRIAFDYLKNIYAAILFKDVTARYNIRNVAFF